MIGVCLPHCGHVVITSLTVNALARGSTSGLTASSRPPGELFIVLSSLFQWAGWRAPFPDPAPDAPLCVIGDVHGCFALLEQMLAKVPQDHRIILAGDYIDRGGQSAQVLRHLSEQPGLTCLKGNHEDMLLRFLADPAREGGRWIMHGGLQTLASFGIRGARPQMTGEELRDCRDRLRQAMGETLIAWVAGLQASVLSGNVLTTHAGADPYAAPAGQPEDVHVWGHPDFLRTPRRDGIWVVHGHTVVREAAAQKGRIAIDTGAYATGRLSAVCLAGGAPRFMTVHA